MKILKAQSLAVVDMTLENKEGEIISIMLHKRGGEWKCPTMTYMKQSEAGFWATFGLRNNWKPSPKMIKAAEKILKGK